MHHGKIKASKHITLEIALKSLKSSKKIIDIINRFGHFCSYTVIEELENEAINVVPKTRFVLCQTRSGLFVNLAFDNFDRYFETFSGKDTLHERVGILF